MYGTVCRSPVSQNETSVRAEATYIASGTSDAAPIAAYERRRGLKGVQLRPTMEVSLSKRVVVAEAFAEKGLEILRSAGITVDSLVGRPRADLVKALETADGLIVRSETKVDRALLGHGPKLAVVARAGVGVDAIDVDAATDAGVIVLNTPAANTLSATEQTFALMLSLARKTPQAVQMVREGVWDRRNLIGTELAGKRLGIVGLGRIGGNVAARARAFGMTVLACDPFISPARAESFDVRLVDLDTLLREADIVTLHVPLTAETRGMIDAAHLAKMQPHAYVINCARGGVVVEEDLLAALDAGKIGGAALDVVAVEPPPPGGSGAKLHRHPKVIATPHLGGSTVEALERIALELAEDVARVLLGAPGLGAVNAPVPNGPEAERVLPFLEVAYRMGRFFPQFASGDAHGSFAMLLQGELAEVPPDPFVRAFLSGMLQVTTERRVSVVNAESIAYELGIRVEARGDASPTPYAGALRVVGGTVSVSGTAVNGSPRIVEAGGFEIDAVPVGAMLVTQHHDVPGMIGRVGTILGNAAVNISNMQVSRNAIGGDAIMILGIDHPADDDTLAALRSVAGIASVRSLTL
jgi:D-3-phosphoglycerate dehydrogenase